MIPLCEGCLEAFKLLGDEKDEIASACSELILRYGSLNEDYLETLSLEISFIENSENYNPRLPLFLLTTIILDVVSLESRSELLVMVILQLRKLLMINHSLDESDFYYGVYTFSQN